MSDKPQESGFDWGWLAVLASLTFAIFPLLRSGLPSVADAAIHLFRTAEWLRIWQDGILYPKWSPNLAFGHGFPLFIFAPPLPYVIAGTLHAVGLSLEVAIKALPVLGFVLMGLGMYLLVRDVLDWRAGVVAAAAFVYAPLQLREAYLYGGNYPQFLAIAMFPWVLWTFRRAVLGNRLVDLLAAGVAYAVLALSHNFHALVFMPVVAAYVLGLLGPERRWASIWRAAAAGALGLALSAAFWLPALYERQWSLAHEGFYIMRSSFQLRFLSWRELLAVPQALDAGAANPYMPFALGWGTIILAVFGLLAPVVVRGLSRQQRYHFIFFALLLALAIFMVLPVSVSVWENVPLLAAAEFPWRVMGIATLSVSFLAGGSMCWLKLWGTPAYAPAARANFAPADAPVEQTTTAPALPLEGEGRLRRLTTLKSLLAAAAVLLVIVTTMVYTYPPKPFTPYGTPTLAESVSYELATQTIGTTTLGEYLPIWVKERPLTSPMIENYLASRPIDKLDRSGLPEGATAELVEHTADGDVYQVSSSSDWTMRLFTFYYPGWVASVDGEWADIIIDEPRGLITVSVPAGDHVVEVHFEDVPTRTVANVISLLAWVLVLAGIIYGIAARWKGRITEPTPAEMEAGDHKGRPHQVAIVAGVILLAFVLRVGTIDPFTAWFRQHSPPGQVIGVQHPARINFEDKIALLGYDLGGEPATQGDRIHIRLYWQALEPVGGDYSAFVHLDALPDLTTRAQSDNVHPGDARAQIDVPVRNWTPESYVRDEHTVAIPAGALPVGYALRVGLYDRDGQRLSVLDETGQVVDDAAFLQVLHVLARRKLNLRAADRTVYQLGEQIELAGAQIESTSLEPGDALRVALFWRAKESPAQDYTAFVHVLDDDGNLIAQSDHQPVGGAYPVSWWWPGQTVEDVHEISMQGVGPGTYRVAVGMYDLDSGERLPVADGTGNSLPHGQIMLEKRIEVAPK
jgi:hypothetical protein